VGFRLAYTPWLQNHSAKTVIWKCDLKCETRVRDVVENFPSCVGIPNCIVDGGIGWRSHDSKDHALIFRRRSLLRRELRNHDEHKERKGRHSPPNEINCRARGQSPVEMTAN